MISLNQNHESIEWILHYTVILDIIFDIVVGISRGEGPLCLRVSNTSRHPLIVSPENPFWNNFSRK